MPVNNHSTATTSKARRGSRRSAERKSEPPLHSKVLTHATGRNEPPQSTIFANVTEFTLADDWVRRTPHELLILPPPPQFADPTPVSSATPSRSHTAASVKRLARSRIAAPATPSDSSLALGSTSTQSTRGEETSSYADVVATPTHTTPHTLITKALPPLQQSTPPAIVVKRLPNWIGHFRTIAEALGHAPNAKAHLKGVKFEPKTEEEFRIVLRCLEEAAASDSEVDYKPPERKPSDWEERRGPSPSSSTPTPTHTSTLHTSTPPGDTQPPAPAAQTEDAPPETASAVTTASEVTRAEATSDTPAPGGRRRRRPRAPRSSRPPVEPPKRRVLLPTPSNIPAQPPDLDTTVRIIVEAIITGVAAYLRGQGATPDLWPKKPQGLTPRWQGPSRWNSGSKHITGEVELPRASPG